MTLNEFQGLSDNEKAECLWDKGKPVAGHDKADAKFLLFQLDSFYIEVEYHTNFTEIVTLNAFETSNIPEAHLQQIELPGFNS